MLSSPQLTTLFNDPPIRHLGFATPIQPTIMPRPNPSNINGHGHTDIKRSSTHTNPHPTANQPRSNNHSLTYHFIQLTTNTDTTSHLGVTSPVPLAATIGLIMPDPSQPVYVGLTYSFGFVDAVSRPAPTIGGWLRQVQPLLTLPNHTVDVLPSSGHSDPDEEGAVPDGSGGLCGATIEDFPIAYPFVFQEKGWYMFVINQTWLQPNITPENTCSLPLLSEYSFFAYQSFSLSPLPTSKGPKPPSPTSTHTVFVAVVTDSPPDLPIDPQPVVGKRALAVGLGVLGGILGVGVILGWVWWVRKRRGLEAEALAFSRLSETDKAAFLSENPNSRLNPNRPSKAGRNGPPGPPGTMAFTQWYWQQMHQGQGVRREATRASGRGWYGHTGQGYPGYQNQNNGYQGIWQSQPQMVGYPQGQMPMEQAFGYGGTGGR